MERVPLKAKEEDYAICRRWFLNRKAIHRLTSPPRLAGYPRIAHDRIPKPIFAKESA